MITKMKTGVIAILLLSAISCTKENINSLSSPAKQSSDNSAKQSLSPGPSANGQAGLTFNGILQNFAFHSSTDASGNVSGSWESKSPDQNVRTHGDIICLNILPDGKTAIMSGVVTHVNDDNPFGVAVGDPVWFKVQDNGEGAKAPVDTFSDYYSSFLSDCSDADVYMRPIETGNIQVKL